MTKYNITCRTLSIDQNRIVKVGLIDASSGLKHSATPKELNSLLRNGDKCYSDARKDLQKINQPIHL